MRVGDALEVEFEFATTRGSGDVSLAFFDDGAEVDSVLLAISGGAVSYALADGLSFDTVKIGTTDSLKLTIDAVEFLRIVPEEDNLFA